MKRRGVFESAQNLIKIVMLTGKHQQLDKFFHFIRISGVCLFAFLLFPAAAQDGSGWQEVRFAQVKVPAGDHTFKITFKNAGKAPVTLNLDDLVLRMKEANR